jgi:hypothetical protein
MEKPHFEPNDARGKRIRKDGRVRVVGLPDFSGIRDAAARRETTAVFKHVQGRVLKVRGFDQYGFAELFFKIRAGRNAGWHGIAIEPNLLLVQKSRKKTKS